MDNKLVAGLAVAGAVAVSGALLYFLAYEDEKEVAVYDSKIHNQELLLRVMEDFEIEYTSLFMHWYSVLKSKKKEIGEIPEAQLLQVKEQIQILTNKSDEEVFAKYKIDNEVFEEWIKKQGDLPKIEQIKSRLSSNFERLLRIQKPEFEFDYPKELTKELYVKYIKLAYAKFRYDIYHHVQKVLQENGQNKLTDDEFNDALKKCSLPEIKNKVYRRMNIPEVEGEEPVRTVMKAYLTMMEDEAWHKEILHIQKEHKKILFEIPEGVKISNLYEDPLDSIDKVVEIEDDKNMDEVKKQQEGAAEVKAKEVESEEPKKKVGGFSFMGNKNDQEQLIMDFLNRNKKDDKEDAKNEDAKKEDSKKEDVKKEDLKKEDAKKEDSENKDVKKEDLKNEDVKKEDSKKEDAKKSEIEDKKVSKDSEQDNHKKDEPQKQDSNVHSDDKNKPSTSSNVEVINKSEADVPNPAEESKHIAEPKQDSKDSKDAPASKVDDKQIVKPAEDDKAPKTSPVDSNSKPTDKVPDKA